MTVNIPPWAAFDEASPPGAPGEGAEAGRVVALVASRTAVAAGWTGGIVASLARSWSSMGLRIVVADAGLERPTLQDAFGVVNEEGLADALLWGASVQKVARPLTADGFYVITSGTPVPDGSDAFSSDRWTQLCSGFREAGVTLVTLIPEGSSGWDSVVFASTDVFLLAGPHEDVTVPATLAGARLRGVFGVDTSRRSDLASPVAPPDDEHPSGPGDGDEWPNSEEEPQASSPPQNTVRRRGPGPVVDREFVPSNRSGRGPRGLLGGRIPRPWLWIALAVVAAVAFMLFRFGVFDRGGGTEEVPATSSGELQAAPTTDTPFDARSPAESSPVQGFSVSVAAYEGAAAALGFARRLATRVPRLQVEAVPVTVDGKVYHRILVGPARDMEDASRIAGDMARALGVDSSTWVVRPTARAFLLGEWDTVDEARGREASLVEAGFPAYVLAVDYSDGSTRYRVYVGAFADETEAEHLSSLLRERGLPSAILTDRIGRLPE
jgi:cell division septation protein DedD